METFSQRRLSHRITKDRACNLHDLPARPKK